MESDRRVRPRVPKRLTCALALTNGERASGLVRDVSRTGLFVQTGARPAPDSLVELILPDAASGDEVRIEAGVARQRVVDRRLAASIRSGLGLEIIPPRDVFERLVFGAEEAAPEPSSETEPAGARVEDGIRAFRFRMVRLDRPEQLVLTIRGETPHAARARALARMGRGWKIASVQRV